MHNCARSAKDDGVLETSEAALDAFSKMLQHKRVGLLRPVKTANV